MSKAMEYSKVLKDGAPRFVPNPRDGGSWAQVDRDGNLRTDGHTYLPSQALALAAWIVETFSDEPSK